jgi:hypothetical protein
LAAVGVAAVLAFGSAPALAASGSPAAAVSSEARVSTATPACSGSVTASPYTQSAYPGQLVWVTVYWYCEGWSHVVANIKWRDGSSDSYTCWANCGSGQTSFSHVYVSSGDYWPYIYMNGSASGSTSVEIYID